MSADRENREALALKFLGSASGDFYLSRPSRRSRPVRRPAQLLLPRGALIDFSSEGLAALRQHRIPLSSINDLFITHSQLDHFHAPTIVSFALKRRRRAPAPLRVWGTAIVRYMLEQETLLAGAADSITFHTLTPLRTYDLDGMHLLPVPGNHLRNGYLRGIGEVCLNFIISMRRSTILYAVDTGYPDSDTWKIWSSHTYKAVMLESTLGDLDKNSELGHLNFEQAVKIVRRLRAAGRLSTGAPAILTHLTPSCISGEEQTKREMAQQQIRLAYDGMEVQI